MNFYDYQREAYQTVKPHDSAELKICDWALGLGGEAGEVQELVKHNVMHREPMDNAKLAKELGDVLWYLAALCSTYGLSLEAVAHLNVAKLKHRHGAQFSAEGSRDRHGREEKFTDTIAYQEIMKMLEV